MSAACERRLPGTPTLRYRLLIATERASDLRKRSAAESRPEQLGVACSQRQSWGESDLGKNPGNLAVYLYVSCLPGKSFIVSDLVLKTFVWNRSYLGRLNCLQCFSEQ